MAAHAYTQVKNLGNGLTLHMSGESDMYSTPGQQRPQQPSGDVGFGCVRCRLCPEHGKHLPPQEYVERPEHLQRNDGHAHFRCPFRREDGNRCNRPVVICLQ